MRRFRKMKNRNVWQSEETGCQKNRHKVKKWDRKTFKVIHTLTPDHLRLLFNTASVIPLPNGWNKVWFNPKPVYNWFGIVCCFFYQIHTCRICLLLTIGKRPPALELTSQFQRFNMQNRCKDEKQRKIWNVHIWGESLLPQTMKWADAEQISDQHRGSPVLFWLPLDYWLCVASLETTAFWKR